MKRMKRMKWVLAVMLGLTLLFASAPVFAAADAEQSGGTAVIAKSVLVPPGISAVPAETYNFVITSRPVQDSNPTEMSPAVNNGTNAISITFAGNETLSTGTDANGYYSASKDSANILADTTFPHAGVYVYYITETAGSTTGITYSSQTYQMLVYVANAEGGGLTTTGVVFNTVNTNGTPADYTDDVVGAKAAPVFSNIYTTTTSFAISKAVAGTYADRTKPFTYNLTLTAAPGVTSGTYTGTIYNGDTATADTVSFALSGSGTLTATNTFTLAHGQSLRFTGNGTDGSTALPVGTTYTLAETGAPGYIPSVAVSSASVVSGTTTILPDTPDVGDGLTVTNALLSGSANTAAFTNTYRDVSPTGIFMDNLPFIVLILVACGGIVAYLALKRRKAHNN